MTDRRKMQYIFNLDNYIAVKNTYYLGIHGQPFNHEGRSIFLVARLTDIIIFCCRDRMAEP